MLNRSVSAVAKAASGGRQSQRLSMMSARSPRLIPSRRTSLLSNTSLNQSLNRSTQGPQVIEENQLFCVTCYDSPLPVQVTEAITLSQRPGDISVKLDATGWAWLVVGRRLFVWKYKTEPEQRFQNPRCHELTLPPSDLSHKAELVCVFRKEPGAVPSCLAVSPEGAVRYWPSVSRETVSTEFNVELHGQECYSLTNIHALGCILATTTGTLVLVTPSSDGRDNTVGCRNLRTAQSLLAGIGRRMATLIFGSSQNQSAELHLVRVLVTSAEGSAAKSLLVLGGSLLQNWTIPDFGAEKLLYECDVDWLCADKFAETLQVLDTGRANEMKTWLIDMQSERRGLVVLAAAVNPLQGQTLRFACGVLDISSSVAPASFRSFALLDYTEPYSVRSLRNLFVNPFLGYRLLLPAPDSDTAFVYRERILLCLSSLGGNYEVVDKVSFDRLGGRIIGCGSCDGTALLFSHKEGILSIVSSCQDDAARTTQQQQQSRSEQVFMSESLNLTADNAQLGALMSSVDPTQQLKAAFLLACMKNTTRSAEAVREIMEESDQGRLNSAVIALGQRLIDDYPAADPRWADAMSQETALTTSLIVLQQLDDKMSAHKLFVDFLKDSVIWDKLGKVAVGNGSTQHCAGLLLQNEEKIVATRAVKSLHTQHPGILDATVKLTLKKRDVVPTGKLTIQDLFYREVSRIDDVFEALLEYETEVLSTEYTAQTQIATVNAASGIFLTVLSQVAKFRRSRIRTFESESNVGQLLSWTSSTGSRGILTLTVKQFEVTLSQAVANANVNLFRQAVDMADVALEGLKYLADCPVSEEGRAAASEQYITKRHAIIKRIVDAKQYEMAAVLAEKYLDFSTLLSLCDVTKNQQRLERYMLQFADQGFRQYAYQWFMQEGKRGQLLSEPALLRQDDLREFLRPHHDISWVMDIRDGNCEQAARTLQQLAKRESDLLSSKKTMCSIAKLCALACEENEDTKEQIADLNQELDLILYQETLPSAVVENQGLDPDNMRVLSPMELVELYVGEDNVNANEYDFKKALDLLHFVQDEEKYKQQLHIWSRAVLRDSWDEADIDVNDPMAVLRQSVFFKTVELTLNEGLEPKVFLPNVDDLLDGEELTPLADNSSFRFVMKAGYEQVMRDSA